MVVCLVLMLLSVQKDMLPWFVSIFLLLGKRSVVLFKLIDRVVMKYLGDLLSGLYAQKFIPLVFVLSLCLLPLPSIGL